MTIEEWAAQRYVSVSSLKRDGTAVATPVWLVGDGAALAFVTPANSGKVKRIRNNPAVSLAPCTMRGRLLGPSVPGRAQILPAGETNRIRALLRRKYGILGWLVMRDRRAGEGCAVRVTPEAGSCRA